MLTLRDERTGVEYTGESEVQVLAAVRRGRREAAQFEQQREQDRQQALLHCRSNGFNVAYHRLSHGEFPATWAIVPVNQPGYPTARRLDGGRMWTVEGDFEHADRRLSFEVYADQEPQPVENAAGWVIGVFVDGAYHAAGACGDQVALALIPNVGRDCFQRIEATNG